MSKGSRQRTNSQDYSAGSIWCDHGRFKDKCDKCQQKKKSVNKKVKK